MPGQQARNGGDGQVFHVAPPGCCLQIASHAEKAVIPIPNKKCVNFYSKSHFRRSRQIKIAGRNFYLESELLTIYRMYGYKCKRAGAMPN
jgi:hypothetical protein